MEQKKIKAKESELVERRLKFMPCIVGLSVSVAYARALLDERGINHLPVVSTGRLVGIISSCDLQPGPPSAKRPSLHKALEMHPNRVRIGSLRYVETGRRADAP
jgi:CBS domain-containing protein